MSQMGKEIDYLKQIESLANIPTIAVLKIVEKYTNEQWLQVQKNCWTIGRSEINFSLGKGPIGYSINGFYLDNQQEEDLKKLLESSDHYIRHLQTVKRAYRPLLKGPQTEIFSFDNWTRFFLARKAAWICSAILGEIQLKGLYKNHTLQLLGMLVDDQNKPLTIQRIIEPAL